MTPGCGRFKAVPRRRVFPPPRWTRHSGARATCRRSSRTIKASSSRAALGTGEARAATEPDVKVDPPLVGVERHFCHFPRRHQAQCHGKQRRLIHKPPQNDQMNRTQAARGYVDESASCGPARALRAVWTARGQPQAVAHRLPTLSDLSPTYPQALQQRTDIVSQEGPSRYPGPAATHTKRNWAKICSGKEHSSDPCILILLTPEDGRNDRPG